MRRVRAAAGGFVGRQSGKNGPWLVADARLYGGCPPNNLALLPQRRPRRRRHPRRSPPITWRQGQLTGVASHRPEGGRRGRALQIYHCNSQFRSRGSPCRRRQSYPIPSRRRGAGPVRGDGVWRAAGRANSESEPPPRSRSVDRAQSPTPAQSGVRWESEVPVNSGESRDPTRRDSDGEPYRRPGQPARRAPPRTHRRWSYLGPTVGPELRARATTRAAGRFVPGRPRASA